MKPLVKNPILVTATGYRMTVHEEAQLQSTQGHEVIHAIALVADLVDDFILGIIWISCGLKNRILKAGN